MNTHFRMAMAALLLAILAGPALAQQDAASGQLVCNSDTGACEWQPNTVPPEAFPGQYDDTQILVEQPLRWLFAWERVEPGAVHARKPPAPQCPATVRQAVAYMQAGALGKDVNLVIAGYDWTGQSSRVADGLMHRMMGWTPGAWQARRVEGRIGGPADSNLVAEPPPRLRWLSTSGDVQAEFEVISRMGCSFLRLVPISPDQPEQERVPQIQPQQTDQVDLQEAESGNIIQILSPGGYP